MTGSQTTTLAPLNVSINDGEAEVERDLGKLREYLEEHSGPVNDSTVDDHIVLQGSGPRRAECWKTLDRESGMFTPCFLTMTPLAALLAKVSSESHDNGGGGRPMELLARMRGLMTCSWALTSRYPA